METKNAKQVYEELKKFDYSIIDYRLSKKDLKGNTVEEVRNEGLKFLALKISDQTKTNFVPSQIADLAWDELVLFTKLYGKIALNFGKFVHHTPVIITDESEKELNQGYHNTLNAYQKVFGKPNPKIWEARSACGEGDGGANSGGGSTGLGCSGCK